MKRKEEEKKSEELRKTRRVPVNVNANYLLSNGDGPEEGDVRIINLSPEGALLEADKPIDKDSILVVKIKQAGMTALCKVVHKQPEDETGKHKMGVSFRRVQED